MKRLILVALSVILVVSILGGCAPKADVVSHNISVAADNFEVTRRIVFYNGITGDYIFVIEGKCSLGNHDPAGELSVTCKIDDGVYVKHFLGLSDNVTYFAEQIQPSQASAYHYRVLFRPSTIIPNPELDK